MSDGRLTFEHGRVALGSRDVPGVLVSLDVGGEVRFDETESDALSGKRKIPLGWEDAECTITLSLLTDDASDCYAKLRDLSAIFKGYDNEANPKVYDVVNAHLLARGVEQVVFSGLSSREDDQSDEIVATLKFTEHLPAVRAKEERTQTGAAPQTTATQPTPAATILRADGMH